MSTHESSFDDNNHNESSLERDLQTLTRLGEEAIVGCYRGENVIMTAPLKMVRQAIESGMLSPSDTLLAGGMKQRVPVSLLNPKAEPAQKQIQRKTGLCCPECGSTKVKKARAIYEEGTTNYNGSSYSQPVTGGATAFRKGRSYNSSGTRQTVLAQKMAQPSGGPGCYTFFVIMISFTIFSASISSIVKDFNPIVVLLGLVVAVLPIILYFNSDFYSNEKAKEAASEKNYANTWHCFKCGSDFIRE